MQTNTNNVLLGNRNGHIHHLIVHRKVFIMDGVRELSPKLSIIEHSKQNVVCCILPFSSCFRPVSYIPYVAHFAGLSFVHWPFGVL
jgi:hypothetical protein